MRRRPNADLEFIRRVIRAITGGIDLDFRSPLPKQLPRALAAAAAREANRQVGQYDNRIYQREGQKVR